jgi:hypothetical protein
MVQQAWDDGPVWYSGYGSNLDPDRFRCYLEGGCPPGATRTYPGAREPGPPLAERAFAMEGTLAFGWGSPTWGGGIAFYDAGGDGVVLTRAYLVTLQQFADVLEQEMRREPGADHDLGPLLGGEPHAVGPGHYETLHLAGELEGRPVVTFSCPDLDEVGINAPAPAYVATIARGLRATHGLTDDEIVDYLEPCPGVDGHLDRPDLLEAIATTP